MKTETTVQTWKVNFVDAEHNRVEVEIELNNGRFSMTGDCGGSSGQCQDEIKPANDAQGKLLKLWHDFHLNDMRAGTPEQEAAIESMTEPYSYDSAVEYLKSKNLLIVPHPETGKPYKYGSAWLTKQLPENLSEQVDEIISEIKEAEEERAGESLKDWDDDDLINLIEEKTSFGGDEVDLCAALVRMFDLCENDLEDIEIDGTRVTVQGTEYLAGNDEQMDELWDEELENYIEECILPELDSRYHNYFDNEAWKRDARIDGRAHSLARYDGREHSVEFNGTEYYAYRN